MAQRSAPDSRGSDPGLTLAEQARLAEERSWEGAYASHRARVLAQRDAPLFASRGRGDCLALVLLPLGLVLLAVHPLPAILVLVAVAWLLLSGSDRQRRDRAAMQAAEAEALRLWLEAGHPGPVGAEEQAQRWRQPPHERPPG